MTKDDEKFDPSIPSAAWYKMQPVWALVGDILGGTRAMHAAGVAHLPQHPMEKPDAYKNRLMGTTLFNMTSLTLESLVGRPFSDPVTLNEDVPEEIADLQNDIDMQGTDLHSFCREWFKEGLSKAIGHIYIDMPLLEEKVDDEGNIIPRTAADDLRENRRPYWTHIKPENVIFARTETTDGVEFLTHVRLREQESYMDGFKEVTVNLIRVLEPGMWAVYQEVRDPKTNKAKWQLRDFGESGLPIIPLVSFYADKEDTMVGKPPIEDLAWVNRRHWVSSSDQNNILTVSRFPILAAAGARDHGGDTMAIGPRQLLTTRDANGRYYYVEHTGKAIAAGRDDIKDLEQQMAAYGAEFLRKRPSGSTATARALDSAEATSALQDQTLRFINAVNKALDITAWWMDLPSGGTVKITTDFGPEELKDVDINTLNDMNKADKFNAKRLSDEDFFLELQRRGMIRDKFSVTDNLNRIRAEIKANPAPPVEEKGTKDDKKAEETEETG